MRRRPTRHVRTERDRYSNRRVSWRAVAVAYGAVLLVPVIFWLVANPVFGAALGALVVLLWAFGEGVYQRQRIGRRLTRLFGRVLSRNS